MMDSITQSFEYIFPQLEIFDGKTWGIGIEKVSEKLIDFLAHFVQTEKYDDLQYRMLVDMYQLMPKDYYQKINQECCRAYFVGYPNVDINQKVETIRKNETKWDWTRPLGTLELIERIKVYKYESQLIQEQCKKYNLPFFDFSKSIDKSTKEIVNYILKDNNYIFQALKAI